MGSRIKILAESLINKIAAGEVVERPASVAKELVENSIDAGATRIVVETKGNGTQLIRVGDDGEGMSRDDALLAVQRHATSKIQRDSDLDSISTLGFRGEALPSIAAVSRMVVETRRAEDLGGTRVTIEGGMVKDVTDIGRGAGTTVTVRDLFFNTPVRRKFLKAPGTEMRHVTQAVMNLALAYPRIAFTLLHDGRHLLDLERHDSYLSRLREVFGKDLMERTVPLVHNTDALHIEGILGRPEIAGGAKPHQLFFVNNRPISNRTLLHAVLAGFETFLLRERHPFFIIFLRMDPGLVDVNVHPVKREVRFTDERFIHDQLFNAVKLSLRAGGVLPTTSPLDRLVERPSVEVRSRPEGRPEEAPISMWQLHRRYILANIKGGLIVVDQHAACERILFEEAMHNLSGKAGSGQQLLFPETLKLNPVQMQVLEEILPLLELMGFGIRGFGKGTVIVDAIPAGLKRWENGKVLIEMVDEMIETGGVTFRLKERLARSYACKSAVKDGDRLIQEEMQILIDRLFATGDPFSCPHGRPTLVKIPLEELDKRFGR